MTERKGITALVGKSIKKIEAVYAQSASGGCYYRFFVTGGGFFDVNHDAIFDEDGMFFEDPQ